MSYVPRFSPRNLQRQDPHPLELAATVQQAFDRGHDVKTVAARLGKSVGFIATLGCVTTSRCCIFHGEEL